MKSILIDKRQAMMMRLQGFTYAKIATALNVAPHRVHRVLAPPKAIRIMVLARANEQCEHCGLGPGTILAVHHRKSVGLESDEYEDMGNLQALCAGCHRAAHRVRGSKTRSLKIPAVEGQKNPAAVALGRRGGQSTSPAKVAASRVNAKKKG
jgi:hypothetical protein